jgi:uncharacterized protein (DUF849 family)
MRRKLILTCAVTGTRDTVKQNPAVPVTPDELIRSCLDAASAGAAVVHIHVRDPATGKASSDLALYRAVVEGIRAKNSQVLLNLTTGPGARLSVDDGADVGKQVAALASPLQRVEHVLALKPEICSLDIGTMSVGDSIRVGTPKMMQAMARLIRDAGVRAEIDVFDSGNILLANQLIADGDIPAPLNFQFVLGAKWGAPADAPTVLRFKEMLPPGALWSAMGVGSAMFPMVALSALLGGNVRLGLEDDIYLDDGVLAPSNAALVEKAVKLLALLGCDVMTPKEARATLGIAA